MSKLSVLFIVLSITLVALPWASAQEPSAEQARETPLPKRTPIVDKATPSATLPCPANTTQSTDPEMLTCRRAPEARGGIPPKEGPSIWFHPNGKLRAEGYYQNNERDGGWWSFREDGTLENYAVYSAGEYNGLYVNFYPDGTRQNEIHFASGKLHGVSKIWSKKGKLETLTVYENDVTIDQQFFSAAFEPASPEELEAMQEELRKQLAEQQRLLESLQKDAP